MEPSLLNIILISIFSVSYLAIIFEHLIGISKTAIAIIAAILLWCIYITQTPESINQDIGHFGNYVYSTAQIFLFLLAAMAIVELVDSHRGFSWVTRYIKTSSKTKLFVVVTIVTFFLSSILDNLTTTILMVTLLKKLIPHKEDRLIPACMVVVAANSGGAWTPIGDVTTTMLWIEGKISTIQTIKTLIIPSLISVAVPLVLLLGKVKGRITNLKKEAIEKPEPGSLIVLILGVLSLVMVPVFKSLTGLPPFMGAMLGLGVLWIVTDFMHKEEQSRAHLKVPTILGKLDVSSVLFFLGILLSVGLLEEAMILDHLALFLNKHLSMDSVVLPTIFGVISAVVDNVPLVAASMGMYPDLPQDSSFWQQVAYAAGVGGSMLIVGSSSGVALMGLDKVTFLDYLKKISFPAAIGFLAGMLYFLFI
jgi:Na+/H+ antiporter NhaD/arsenite permease-like protein